MQLEQDDSARQQSRHFKLLNGGLTVAHTSNFLLFKSKHGNEILDRIEYTGRC